jgi:hypothetical protein
MTNLLSTSLIHNNNENFHHSTQKQAGVCDFFLEVPVFIFILEEGDAISYIYIYIHMHIYIYIYTMYP